MILQKKHYIIFYSPGTLFSESSSREIDSWDIKKATDLSKEIKERYDATPYGFVFETYVENSTKPLKRSGIHFLTGTLIKYDDIKENYDNSILLSNMRDNNFPIVCENTNSYRSTMPFNESDCVVDMDGNIVIKGDDPELVEYRVKKNKEFDDYYNELARKYRQEKE